jgi:hypothetical protein
VSTGLTIAIDGTIIVVRGFKAGARLKASGIGKPIYSTTAGGWLLDRKRLPDLEAWLESRRIGYVIDDPDQAELDLGEVVV